MSEFGRLQKDMSDLRFTDDSPSRSILDNIAN